MAKTKASLVRQDTNNKNTSHPFFCVYYLSTKSGSNGRYRQRKRKRQRDLFPWDSISSTVATDETEVLPGAQRIPGGAVSSDSIEERTVNNRRHQRQTESDIGEEEEEEKQSEDTANK